MNLLKTTVFVLSGLSLTGCVETIEYISPTQPEVSNTSGEVVEGSKAETLLKRNAINPNLSGTQKLSDITSKTTPTLGEMVDMEYYESEEEASEDEEDKLRLPAMKDTALAYGARGGLAYTSWQINKMLQKRASHLNKIYDFNKLVLRGPDNSKVLPPVISEAKKAFELKEGGKSIRIADQVYEIIKQAKFSPTAPMWHTYLIREYSAPNEPNPLILPKNEREKKLWEKYIREGWNAGSKQANEIFESDLNRLERDYQGMVRYLALLNEGKVSKPIIAKGDLGITGGGQSMRVNDRNIRITKEPGLISDSDNWSPTVNHTPSSSFRSHEVEKIKNFPRPISRRY